MSGITSYSYIPIDGYRPITPKPKKLFKFEHKRSPSHTLHTQYTPKSFYHQEFILQELNNRLNDSYENSPRTPDPNKK